MTCCISISENKQEKAERLPGEQSRTWLFAVYARNLEKTINLYVILELDVEVLFK